ncbi:Vesicle-trafficking protein isoform 1 [Schistosoma japonicum]|uniref:Vesicle-trafficking protein SEC22b n=1 Tax=Schistosoma japonicum TaxID=6182 RepID=A0A4Z2D933_SCHJA|nr:Vesicle-trafficking protein SEC22b [Schistosoma japonicum]TNN12984.1 Vesicle-trafficking protein isoform 1 [Schistosoma japonicum]
MIIKVKSKLSAEPSLPICFCKKRPLSKSCLTTLNRDIFQYQNQAKTLVCRMTPTSPSRCSLIAGPYLFHYLLDLGVCYIILTDSQFSRTKAFAFLEAIQAEFYGKYNQQIHTVSRPYAFLDFDHVIHKTQKIYSDTRSSNLSQLNVALQDVQRIMIQNIDDVLQRGEALSTLDSRASDLSTMSKKYRQDTYLLNLQSTHVKYILFCIVLILVFTYFYVQFL